MRRTLIACATAASLALAAVAHAETQTYFGFTNVFCWANGEGPISEYFAAPIPGGSVVTATATDPYGNTSEFSVCIASINTPSGGSVYVVPVDEMVRLLRRKTEPVYEAVAYKGPGVFETLKGVAKLVLADLTKTN